MTTFDFVEESFSYFKNHRDEQSINRTKEIRNISSIKSGDVFLKSAYFNVSSNQINLDIRFDVVTKVNRASFAFDSYVCVQDDSEDIFSGFIKFTTFNNVWSQRKLETSTFGERYKWVNNVARVTNTFLTNIEDFPEDRSLLLNSKSNIWLRQVNKIDTKKIIEIVFGED